MPLEVVLPIIDRGGTPVVTWAREGEDVEYHLIVAEFPDTSLLLPGAELDSNGQPSTRHVIPQYMAISHV